VKKTVTTINDPGFEKKNQILDVAEELFSANGFDGVSVRDLSKKADINIAMISYYFGSKENLYVALIERKMITIRQDLGDAFPNGGSAWEKLSYIIDRYVDKIVDNRKFMNIVFSELGTTQREQISNFLRNRFADNQNAFKEIIEQGIKDGEFRHVDAQLTIVSIIGPLKLYVSNPMMVQKLLNEPTEEGAYSKKHRDRMKAHLTDMMERFLKP
jgi:AcrR family transcriptional regulator